MSKHIPTPWKVEFKEHKTECNCQEDDILYAKISDSKGRPISVWTGSPIKANTQFIVQACNSHDELVEALKTILEACDNVGEHIDITAYNKAEEALRKAGAL